MVGGGAREHGAGAGHVPDGAVAHGAPLGLLTRAGPGHRGDGEPHAVAAEDLALVGVVQARQGDVLALDVAPHVQLGPVGQGEDPHVLARGVPGVEQRPQLGALIARIPLPELIAQGEDALLGPSLLLVAPAPAEDAVEAVRGDRVEQWAGLQRVAGAVGALAQPAVVDVVLDGYDDEPHAGGLGGGVAVGQDLGEVVPGIDVEQREGHGPRPEGLARQVEHHHRVLAAAEQQDGAGALGDRLADDEDRLGLQRVELVERGAGSGGRGGAHRWIPHSVLVNPAQRPERGSSPGATRAVQGSQPIEG
ncbi:hypothetical protein GCM10011612_13260 [Actinomyces gaoshouyii]|uniref:Uncharacterized protein n=1 Tax=Actinomyces gaoshouyii TaxID=1960083 RepID=A0A8H9HBI5_9ACTO|nr:hypothetical protein GCM10011612_13260 [Actinomyces gaoshouyii]